MFTALITERATADSTSAWRIGGMIDANAQHTVESPKTSLFGLELAMVDLKYTTPDVRARVALHGGNYVDRNYVMATPVVPSLLHAFHAAHAGLRLADELWVDIGIMPSHIGNESAISSENITYTRSIIAETRPYFGTGAKVSWQISKALGASVLALNGWKNIYDFDAQTAFGSLVVLEPSSQWKFGWSTFIGDVTSWSSGHVSTRYFNDFYASFTDTDLTVAAAFDFAKQEVADANSGGQLDSIQATWYGATLQARLRIDSVIAFNARIESFSDPENVVRPTGDLNQVRSGLPYNVIGGSIGMDVTPRQYTQLRLEARMLHATQDIFRRPIEGGPSEYRPNQLWFTAAVVITIP